MLMYERAERLNLMRVGMVMYESARISASGTAVYDMLELHLLPKPSRIRNQRNH